MACFKAESEKIGKTAPKPEFLDQEAEQGDGRLKEEGEAQSGGSDEVGKCLYFKHHIQPEYGDEQADAGRDCRTRLTRPNSQARTGTGKNAFFLLG